MAGRKPSSIGGLSSNRRPGYEPGGKQLSEERLKIAVFIDFDNIEIGVKSTLNRNFDIGAVLEAIKERGEIVTKVAYGDWKRAGDHGRAMGQHAIHMVQRNLTPGGDKNGADINLALDALEMAFTRDHINTFVIVGGDSDFITLVEKLKQYDKKVFVVGGRAFTSAILQKNCHEFIAYENLIRSGRRQSGRTRSGGEVSFDKAVPLVLRALKILTDREVSPQIGLLKSTLLQLDSTFTERDYGASSFRDFVEKLARTGVITLKHMDRSILVEPGESGPGEVREEEKKEPQRARSEAVQTDNTEPAAPSVSPERMEEGVQRVRQAFEKAEEPVKWPMYLRTVRQLLKVSDPDFDESDYGFRGLQDALRAVQRTGFLRLERNRQGVLRILPGDGFPKAAEEAVEGAVADASELAGPEAVSDEPAAGPSTEEALTGESVEPAEGAEAEEAAPAEATAAPKTTRRTKASSRRSKASRTSTATKTSKTSKTSKASKVGRAKKTERAPGKTSKKVTRKKKAPASEPEAVGVAE